MSPKKQISNNELQCETKNELAGRLLALDPGDKRVGAAISDEMHLTVRPLRALRHTNWKKLLSDVKELLKEFDAKALVIGLPLSLDGIERSSAQEARQLARKFALSLDIPVFLQDERLTSREAEDSMRAAGRRTAELRQLLDSESAAIILRDFIGDPANHLKVKP